MSKENTATVYELDRGAYLINKQPQLINDRQLKEELQCRMYFKKHLRIYKMWARCFILDWNRRYRAVEI